MWLLINKSDALHDKARNEYADKLVRNGGIPDGLTSCRIANALSRVPFRYMAVQIISLIQSSANTIVVRIDKDIFA